MNSQSIRQAPLTSALTYRPVGPDDDALLLELYASTRAAEMAMVPWNAEQRQAFLTMQFAAQQEHYRNKYPMANHEIILSNGRPVGRRYVARLEQEIRIVDITVMPAERNVGIGTSSLRELLNEAVRTDRAVKIYVEDFNPSLRLFDRLGFRKIEELGIHLLLEWSPTESSKGQADSA